MKNQLEDKTNKLKTYESVGCQSSIYIKNQNIQSNISIRSSKSRKNSNANELK